MEVKWEDLKSFKITILGNAATGKTAVCNRLVSNFFPVIYEPTVNVENYSFLFNLSEIQVKRYAIVVLEDVFGLNNPLLQTFDSLITSEDQKLKKNEMTKIFKDIMFTSMEQRKALSSASTKIKDPLAENRKQTKMDVYEKIFCEDPNKKLERKGFVFVCDCSDESSVDDIITIIEKLIQIEKTNNLIYPKLIMMNKKDKVDVGVLEKLKKKISGKFNGKKTPFLAEVSALTNDGITDSFKKFMSTIQQEEEENVQNKGLEEGDPDDDIDEENKVNCYLFRLIAMISSIHVRVKFFVARDFLHVG